MPDSKRQQIVDALATAMATITTGNGYQTDAGANVSTWLIRDLDETELPSIEVRDVGQSVGSAISTSEWNLNVEIEITAAGTTAPAICRAAMADVYQALGVDNTLGGLAIRVDSSGDDLTVDQTESKIARGTVAIEVAYRTTGFLNPYS